jgi:hypothetical protein
MRTLVLVPILSIACLWAGDDPRDQNVNSKYKVESVKLSSPLDKKIKPQLREELDKLVGQNFDPKMVSEFAQRLHRELRIVVTHRVEKGLQPEHVRVIYEGRERRWDEDDAKVTKLAYHQKQGWTGGVVVSPDIKQNRFEFGIQSDADRLIERYAGITAGFSRPLGTDRVRIRFEFETYHQQWNPATEAALTSRPDVPGTYRERYNLEPSVVILLTPGLSLSTGLSFQNMQPQFSAATDQAANAVITTLRHRRRWSPSNSIAGHELDAGYSLRAATNVLDSDFVYARHSAHAYYTLRYGKNVLDVRGQIGRISGRAPLYDRFALGDTRTLRGWNKFDVDPLGGSRVAHASIQYRYRFVGVFYDTGAVWDRGEDASTKHAVGFLIALSSRGGPFLGVGFPLRSGGVTPLFMMGTYF